MKTIISIIVIMFSIIMFVWIRHGNHCATLAIINTNAYYFFYSMFVIQNVLLVALGLWCIFDEWAHCRWPFKNPEYDPEEIKYYED